MLKLSREKELRQAGYEIGYQVDPDIPIDQGPNAAIHAANDLGLKGESRIAFLSGSGEGRAARIGDAIESGWRRSRPEGGAA